MKCITQQLPCLGTVTGLPTVSAKIRALYATWKGLLPEEVVGPFIDVRHDHLSMDQPQDCAVEEVARVFGRLAGSAQMAGNVRAFGVKGRHPKGCVCCGMPPPETPYRWRKRICPMCENELRKNGTIVEAGRQVQENLQVGTCFPGIVWIVGEEKTPPPAK